MDDETLYFFIRVNEMQIALSRQINEIPKLKFQKSMDYFWYGLDISINILGLLLYLHCLFGFSS